MFNRKRFDAIDRHLDKLELYLEIRDPGTARSAESFDQLRKQIAAGAHTRQNHLADLARLDAVATTAADLSTMRTVIAELMEQGGLVRLDDPRHKGAFDVSGEPGDFIQVDVPAYFQVDVPAYFDAQTEQIVRRGSGSWVSAAPDSLESVSASGATTASPDVNNAEAAPDGSVPPEVEEETGQDSETDVVEQPQGDRE